MVGNGAMQWGNGDSAMGFQPIFKQHPPPKKKHAKTVKLENKLKELQQNPYYIFNRNYLDY